MPSRGKGEVAPHRRRETLLVPVDGDEAVRGGPEKKFSRSSPLGVVRRIREVGPDGPGRRFKVEGRGKIIEDSGDVSDAESETFIVSAHMAAGDRRSVGRVDIDDPPETDASVWGKAIDSDLGRSARSVTMKARGCHSAEPKKRKRAFGDALSDDLEDRFKKRDGTTDFTAETFVGSQAGDGDSGDEAGFSDDDTSVHGRAARGVGLFAAGLETARAVKYRPKKRVTELERTVPDNPKRVNAYSRKKTKARVAGTDYDVPSSSVKVVRRTHIEPKEERPTKRTRR